MPVPSLGGGRTHRVQIPLPTARRAVVPIGPLRAVRGDVFGLIRRVVQWPLSEQVYVHPRTVRPSSALPGFVRDLEGEESTLRTASDLSFHALREYVPGDDRRFIHWKSTARNRTLQVREFLQTHRSLVVVVLSGGPVRLRLRRRVRARRQLRRVGGRRAGPAPPRRGDHRRRRGDPRGDRGRRARPVQRRRPGAEPGTAWCSRPAGRCAGTRAPRW